MNAHPHPAGDDAVPASTTDMVRAVAMDAAECLSRFVALAWLPLAMSISQVPAYRLHELADCIHDYAVAMRSAGAGPERVIASVKDLVNATVRVSDAVAPIMDFVVPRAIHAYYAS